MHLCEPTLRIQIYLVYVCICYVYGCNFLFQCSHIELWKNVIIVVDNLFDIYLILHRSKEKEEEEEAMKSKKKKLHKCNAIENTVLE